MFLRLLLIGVFTLLTSCSDMMDISEQPPFLLEDGKELVVLVNNQPISKACVESTYLPEGAEIGVFLRATDGSNYDGVAYNNIKYTSFGSESSQTWDVETYGAIRLTSQKGQAYAYYPWTSSATSQLKIPISNDGTDWMFSTESAFNLSSTNNVAQFTMAHAMTLIRCKVVKGNYVDTGLVTALSVSGSGLGTNGFMDLSQAKVTDITGAGTEIVENVTGQLGPDPFSGLLWAVPTGEIGALSFKVTVDGNPYVASSNACEILSGKIYDYTLTVNSKGLDVSMVSVKNWSDSDQGVSEPLFTDVWEPWRQVDGVYAIDDYGRPVAYAEATAETYQGAALIIKGKVYQVAKVNAPGHDGTDKVYWWRTGYFDIGGLKNYIYIDGENTSGYIDGTTTPQLPSDPAQWIVGAISDFDGARNTEAIIAAQTIEGVIQDETLGQAVVNFRNDAERNEGFTDWFVPSCGEYAYMYRNRTALNELLLKAGGVGLTNPAYWTSTERAPDGSWYIAFARGGLFFAGKANLSHLRLVRHL